MRSLFAPAIQRASLQAPGVTFDGEPLAEAEKAIPLNQPSCAKFCLLGGCSCSGWNS